MQLENIVKVISKANNQYTASQCNVLSTALESRQNRFNQTLKTTKTPVRSIDFIPNCESHPVGSSIGKREQRVLCVKTN
jgi:hypothetical protein